MPGRLGPYTVGRKLGAGGMATVYAARRDGATGGELVALKLLSPSIAADDPARRAFLRESAIATRLEHPNVVHTIEVGERDGVMFIAMELVHGVPLAAIQKASRGPAPLDIALRITCDVARALHAAHELADPQRGPLGLVHQDVSPSNILVGYDGVTKLVDFGVARLASFEGSRTESLKGKPSYASPEQINGKHIDRRIDVFALGIVLWEMLTGERLFRRDTSAATYVAVLNEPIPDVRQKNPHVPDGVAAAVARALDRNRDARFPTADALRRALDEARGERIPEASQEELAFWVAQLVPPKVTFAELRRELDAVSQDAAIATSATLPANAVPDLDLPAPSRAPAPAPAPAPPPPAPPDAATIDELDMEIERDGALVDMARLQASASAPPRPARSLGPASSGLEVAHRRPIAPPPRRSWHDEPSLGALVGAHAGAAVVVVGVAAALVKLAHRAGGRPIASLAPSAFDGTSVVASGVTSAIALVVALALGVVGLRLHPRSWALVVSGGAMLVTSLAMVTVTLVATEHDPSPPDGALLVPWVVPVALAALAFGIAGRAARLFLDDELPPKLGAAPLAAFAGALLFVAVEASALASRF